MALVSMREKLQFAGELLSNNAV